MAFFVCGSVASLSPRLELAATAARDPVPPQSPNATCGSRRLDAGLVLRPVPVKPGYPVDSCGQGEDAIAQIPWELGWRPSLCASP
jgi:hypothetical protein